MLKSDMDNVSSVLIQMEVNSMFNLTFSKEELDYLELLLQCSEYEEDERWLHESIEANIHFAKADSLDKVTEIGGK